GNDGRPQSGEAYGLLHCEGPDDFQQAGEYEEGPSHAALLVLQSRAVPDVVLRRRGRPRRGRFYYSSMDGSPGGRLTQHRCRPQIRRRATMRGEETLWRGCIRNSSVRPCGRSAWSSSANSTWVSS